MKVRKQTEKVADCEKMRAPLGPLKGALVKSPLENAFHFSGLPRISALA